MEHTFSEVSSPWLHGSVSRIEAQRSQSGRVRAGRVQRHWAASHAGSAERFAFVRATALSGRVSRAMQVNAIFKDLAIITKDQGMMLGSAQRTRCCFRRAWLEHSPAAVGSCTRGCGVLLASLAWLAAWLRRVVPSLQRRKPSVQRR